MICLRPCGPGSIHCCRPCCSHSPCCCCRCSSLGALQPPWLGAASGGRLGCPARALAAASLITPTMGRTGSPASAPLGKDSRRSTLTQRRPGAAIRPRPWLLRAPAALSSSSTRQWKMDSSLRTVGKPWLWTWRVTDTGASPTMGSGSRLGRRASMRSRSIHFAGVDCRPNCTSSISSMTPSISLSSRCPLMSCKRRRVCRVTWRPGSCPPHRFLGSP
mmetsp:Transcript_4256/g.8732  ORF Transcript_4256/g.8732 Transcript_4256/m.8732 type:complete len:218 (+) Transcript_4256:212-865(+)